MNKHSFPIILLFVVNLCLGQYNPLVEKDKCITDQLKEIQMHELLGKNWGYSYDSLLNDLNNYWELSDYVQVQSIGQSVQGREQYELTITNFDVAKTDKRRIYIHARTHPGEIQCFWVTDEMINYLIEDTDIGNFLRDHCIFHIVPMYNPDGVELGYGRENANGVDLEREWGKENPEVEVVNLKSRFEMLMMEENPIEVALNMHSSVDCERYFYYHHENGTSVLYTEMEKEFIGAVRSHFLSGIQPWDFKVTWIGGAPDHFPESWWWFNHAEEILALGYEDMNCASAGLFDRTAYALLHGISDYLGLGYVTSPESFVNDLQAKAYPNPFNDEIKIEWNINDDFETAFIIDLFGKTIKTFKLDELGSSEILWRGNNMLNQEVQDGIYFLILQNKNGLKNLKIIKQ